MTVQTWLNISNVLLLVFAVIGIGSALIMIFIRRYRGLISGLAVSMLMIVFGLAIIVAFLQQNVAKTRYQSELVVVQRQSGQNQMQLQQVRHQLLAHPNDRVKLQRSFQLADRQIQLQKQIGGLQTKLKAQQ